MTGSFSTAPTLMEALDEVTERKASLNVQIAEYKVKIFQDKLEIAKQEQKIAPLKIQRETNAYKNAMRKSEILEYRAEIAKLESSIGKWRVSIALSTNLLQTCTNEETELLRLIADRDDKNNNNNNNNQEKTVAR